MILEGLETAEDQHFIKLNKQEALINEERKHCAEQEEAVGKEKEDQAKKESNDMAKDEEIEGLNSKGDKKTEGIVFEIRGDTDDEEITNKSSKRLQIEFEKQYKFNEHYLLSEDTKDSDSRYKTGKNFMDEHALESDSNVLPGLGYQFFQIMMLVLLGEIGDRSQVSIIYISNSNSFSVVLGAIVISNFLLCILSVLCGQLLATRFSIRTLTIVSGWLFVLLGFIALMITLATDFDFMK
eukprot:CAMPEP_0170514518 /NCGR_PEP_ID=MMETSP0209-20121228/1099_1 /TAXON_ID=665100 ORGANISM="Litonotus pictus, Strain P1" /NCGR_SAMPLE_ID=MMETSP0209 /ASSEMBLY_ACC=CAM_ASM_000301 /LENGTH=238 /DNA_ID=CAMNT_0010798647 /DNA_START=764 /DNA_END=1483 /DNA_ORIENTATION=+